MERRAIRTLVRLIWHNRIDNMAEKFTLNEKSEDLRVNEICEVLIEEQATTFKMIREQEQLNEITSRSKSLCEYCGHDLGTVRQLTRHKMDHKLGLPMCPICPLKPFFRTKEAYLAHLRLHKNIENLSKCDFCCTLLSKNHRRAHIQAHKTLKLRRCYAARCH